jgi:hypothetical protein
MKFKKSKLDVPTQVFPSISPPGKSNLLRGSFESTFRISVLLNVFLCSSRHIYRKRIPYMYVHRFFYTASLKERIIYHWKH